MAEAGANAAPEAAKAVPEARVLRAVLRVMGSDTAEANALFRGDSRSECHVLLKGMSRIPFAGATLGNLSQKEKPDPEDRASRKKREKRLALVELHVAVPAKAFEPGFLSPASFPGDQNPFDLLAHTVDRLVAGIFAIFGVEEENALGQ